MDGMNLDIEMSDEEDDENIDDIGIANELVEIVYGTVDVEEDDNEDDVDIFTPDQLLPIQTPHTDEVSMPIYCNTYKYTTSTQTICNIR